MINAVGRDQFRQQRFRSGQRRGDRLGFAGRIHPRSARRSLDQGHRAARRQPGRLVDGVRRDLARAVDLAREPAAGDRVDVGSRRVGRLLHRARRRRDRRAAGHAHRIDRRLHRQVRHDRHARQARRQHREHEQRQARRDLFTGSPVHAGRAVEDPGVDADWSTTSSSSAPPRRATCRPRRSTRSRRAGCGPASRRSSSGWSTSSAASTRRSIWPSSGRAFPRTRKWSWWCIRRGAASTRCWPTNCQSPVGRLRSAHTSDALMELLGPRERTRARRRARAVATVPLRAGAGAHALRVCAVGRSSEVRISRSGSGDNDRSDP